MKRRQSSTALLRHREGAIPHGGAFLCSHHGAGALTDIVFDFLEKGNFPLRFPDFQLRFSTQITRSKLALSIRRTAYTTTMFGDVLGVLIVMGVALIIVWLSWITMWLYYKIVE